MLHDKTSFVLVINSFLHGVYILTKAEEIARK